MKQFRRITYPYIVWIAALIIAPMLLILLYAFTVGGNDVATVKFSFSNFVRFVTDKVFLQEIGRAHV